MNDDASSGGAIRFSDKLYMVDRVSEDIRKKLVEMKTSMRKK